MQGNLLLSQMRMMKTMSKLSELGALSIQGALSLMLAGTCCYLWATANVVPESLLAVTTMVIAHWMGRKAVTAGVEAGNPAPAPVFIPGDK